MSLSEKHIKQFSWFYLLCFLMNYAWFWWNGLLFSTLNPVFFLNGLDFTRNLLMLTNLQHWLIKSYWLRIVLDVVYLLLPVLLTIANLRSFKAKPVIATATIVFTIVYAIFFTSISYVSMQGFMSWILIPLILSATSARKFYYYIHIVRLLFITMFVAAAVEKIASGAVFNVEQMSGILLKQHGVYLVSSNGNGFTQFIYFLINHKTTSFIFYIAGTAAELLFAVGLFTRKYDRLLIIVFCTFLLADYFVMQIYYFIWLVFTGCFYFSAFPLDEKREYN
ncbi:hypothetical protein [Ferruginibacter sp.]|uniref:hypothetical protein n=1 Tax=Ferruginibacter sp. TaxID=1940288 RepID=UPI00265AB7A1|nr:hypothetical protein [Ferruginibacter sp.]